MKRIALVFLIVVPIASAAAITAGAYTVNMPPASIGTPSAFLSNFVTTDFTIVAMGSRSTEPFFPVRCVVNDPLAAPCTITAGTSYSATYTNLNQTGMTLLYNGATYTLGGGSCGTCFALPWQLTLTYSPTTSFTYGPAGAPGVPGAAVLYNVTGSLTVGSPSGVGFLINNDPLTGSAMGTVTLVNAGSLGTALNASVSFAASTPEPGSMGLLATGLALVFAYRRQRK